MLIYHPESDSLFWDEKFDLESADGGLCSDVGEELWAVERAQDLGLPVPDIERHIAYLRDLAENAEPMPVDDPENEYWEGL